MKASSTACLETLMFRLEDCPGMFPPLLFWDAARTAACPRILHGLRGIASDDELGFHDEKDRRITIGRRDRRHREEMSA